MNQKYMNHISPKMQTGLKISGKGGSDKRGALNFTKPRVFEMHFKKLDKLRLWLDFPFVDLFYSLSISIENSVVEKWERRVLRFF